MGGEKKVPMQCPACGHQAISFLGWCQGLAALNAFCQHCGTPLIGNKNTKVGLLFCLAGLCSATMAAIAIDIDKIGFIGFSAMALAGSAPGLLVGWLRGGYEVNEGFSTNAEVGSPEHTEMALQAALKSCRIRVWGMTFLLFFALVFPFVLYGFTPIAHLMRGQEGTAIITEVDSSTGTVLAEFRFGSEVHHLEDVVAPRTAQRLQPGNPIAVTFDPKNPGKYFALGRGVDPINRLLMFVILAALTGFLALRFWRMKREIEAALRRMRASPTST
ncbi:MAG: hypothetical protein R3F11_23215 [Verrucomicrobiales bacterium]